MLCANLVKGHTGTVNTGTCLVRDTILESRFLRPKRPRGACAGAGVSATWAVQEIVYDSTGREGRFTDSQPACLFFSKILQVFSKDDKISDISL